VCPRAEDPSAKESRASRYPNWEETGRPAEPQKGMFRSRERNTAFGGQNAGAHPDRDSHLPEGSPEGWREAKGPEAQERMASRVVSPRALARP
jgi:hypothetical protein